MGDIKMVVLQPTSLCNLNCSYCYVGHRKDATRMSTDVLRAVFNTFLGSERVQTQLEFLWHAGEPLTVGRGYYQQAVSLAHAANTRQLRLQHTVQTNGLLIDDDWCDFLVDQQFSVGISMDGPQFLHDASRVTWAGGGSHTLSLRGYERLAAKGVHAGVLCVLTRQSLLHADAIYDFFLSIGARWVAFNIEEVEGQHRNSSVAGSGDIERHYADFMRYFFRRWLAEGQPFRIREVDDFLSIVQPLSRDDVYFRRPDETAAFKIVTVQKNGDVSTFSPEFAGARAPQFNDFVVGNILRDSLETMIGSPALQTIQFAVNDGVRNCASTCQWFSFCGGGYVSNKFYEHGDLSATETTACRLHRQTLSQVLLRELTALTPVRGYAANFNPAA